VVIWVRNLTHFKCWKKILGESISVQSKLKLLDFCRVHISWIPGTHILPIINNFAETLCDVDDWIFHCLSLCLSPFSVYYLCRSVTVCTLKKMWGYVMVIFHILSIQQHWFETDQNAKKMTRNSRKHLFWRVSDSQFFLAGWPGKLSS